MKPQIAKVIITAIQKSPFPICFFLRPRIADTQA